MKENSKSVLRRLADSNYGRRYLVGDGVDIGGKPDPLALYREFFPLMRSVRTWDMEDGDAQFMAGVADGTFDFVFSSHCLEHLGDPAEGLRNWLRVLKPGGHLVIAVPDEDLYEQGVWPSTHNKGHRHTFTVNKQRSWSPSSINLLTLLADLGPEADVRKLEVLDQTYRYDLPRFDQTLTPIGECGIEIVVRRRTLAELDVGGRLPGGKGQPAPEMRVYYNQYRADQAALRQLSAETPPFGDKREI
jgi:SAM-dependent methyltransferase